MIGRRGGVGVVNCMSRGGWEVMSRQTMWGTVVVVVETCTHMVVGEETCIHMVQVKERVVVETCTHMVVGEEKGRVVAETCTHVVVVEKGMVVAEPCTHKAVVETMKVEEVTRPQKEQAGV